MVLITVGCIAMGALFASVDVTIVAFCSEQGHRSWTGAVLACVAIGSGVAGFFYGTRSHPTSPLRRFRSQAVALGILPVLLPLSPGIAVLAPAAFVVGLGVAPTLITASELIQRIVDRSVLTEGLAWLVTGLNLGYGAGSALVGHIADAYGARSGFFVAVAAGVLVAVAAVLVHARVALPPQPLTSRPAHRHGTTAQAPDVPCQGA